MKALFPRSVLSAVALLAVAAGCSDTPVQPQAETPEYTRQFYHGSNLGSVLNRVHVGQGEVVRGKVGRLGGVLAANGAVLVIPPRALSAEIEITMTVPGGSLNVELEPHGLQFSKHATLGFLLDDTEFSGRRAEDDLIGVYHTDGLDASEVAPRELLSLRVYNNLATFGVWHFSNYSIVRKKGLILVGG